MNKEQIAKMFQENRPNLSQSSIHTYTSILNSLYNKLHLKNVNDFEKQKQSIIQHINTLEKPQTKKTLLSALFVLTDIKDYKLLMDDNVKAVNDFYKEKKVSDNRIKTIKSYEDLQAINQEYQTIAKQNPTEQNMANAILSYLYSGCNPKLPPRRVKDYNIMKIKDYNKETDNFIANGWFYFNAYKTKGKYGTQRIQVPKDLLTMINKLKKMNTSSDYLFTNEKGEPYSQPSFSRKIMSLFGGTSVDVLRSIYITHIYKDNHSGSLEDALDKVSSVATGMGNSTAAQQEYYVKNDIPK